MVKKCWICGSDVTESAVGPKERFHTEIRLVNVNRPYSQNFKSKSVWVCIACTIGKIGMSGEGQNLNSSQFDVKGEEVKNQDGFDFEAGSGRDVSKS